MKVKMTLDIFSGRPNPTIEVSGAEAKKILKQLEVQSAFRKNTKATAPEPVNLGFRGIILEQSGNDMDDDFPAYMRITPDRVYGAGDTSAAANDSAFENLIFDKLPKFKDIGNDKQFKKILLTQIEKFRIERPLVLEKYPFKWEFPVMKTCSCAPDHEIAWWNDDGLKQRNNNCYNYATNYRTNTFAQPGRSSGQMYTSLSGCSVAAGKISAKQGAVADSLLDLPGANNKCPLKGHLVALVVAPDYDYHWYRKGFDGKWSHKPGGTRATLVDNIGNAISDPRTANRGPYTQFCSFMQVINGHVKIS